MKSHFVVGNILRIAVQTWHIGHGLPFGISRPYSYFYREMLSEANNSQTVPLIFSYIKGVLTQKFTLLELQ